jgi:hypothetical protein
VLLVAVIAAPLLFVSPGGVLIVATALSTAAYAATVTHRLFLFRASIRPSAAVVITDSEARAVPARSLPLYTVLIPAYREPQVIADLLASIDALEYPTERLDVKLILEQDDEETIAAVETARPGGYVQVLLVPPSQPRTKPKALNYGLTYARGELVTPRTGRTLFNCGVPLSPSHAAIRASLVSRPSWRSTILRTTSSPDGLPLNTRCGSTSTCPASSPSKRPCRLEGPRITSAGRC